MPSTHTALYYHLVFSTKNRENWLNAEIRPRIHTYLGGIVKGQGGVGLAVGGISDHVHILASLEATHRLCDVMREVKGDSSRWIKQTFGLPKFAWQEGYGGFTVSPPDLEKVRSYVLNQEKHHQKSTFKDEYLGMLRRGLVEFDDRYLW
jgi:putative transposase